MISMHLNKTLKKGLGLILLMVFCLSTFCPTLLADETRVYDQAKLFTSEDIAKLETSISSLKSEYPLDIVIVTTNDAEGKTSQTYADDFYDNGGFGYNGTYDGILLLIDMDNRNVSISTDGEMPRYFNDTRISTMLDHVIAPLKNGEYAQGAYAFLDDVKTYMDKGIVTNNLVYRDFKYSSNTPHEPFKNQYGQPLSISDIALCLLIAAVAALIITFIVRAIIIHTYKHPRFTTPSTRPDRSSVHYTERQDHFVTSHTSRTKIQSNNNSSGGSSIHKSSGGHSHGGGSRGF